MSRRDARETAFHLLYQLSLQKSKRLPQEAFFWELIETGRHALCEQERFRLSADDIDYAKALVKGIYPRSRQLDLQYAPYLKGWKVGRLPLIDRHILRMALYELLERPDVPKAVVVNEAVLLAKKYSNDSSRIYINAVLGRIVRGEGPGLRKEKSLTVDEEGTEDAGFGVFGSAAAAVETALSHPGRPSGIAYGAAVGEILRRPPSRDCFAYVRAGRSF